MTVGRDHIARGPPILHTNRLYFADGFQCSVYSITIDMDISTLWPTWSLSVWLAFTAFVLLIVSIWPFRPRRLSKLPGAYSWWNPLGSLYPMMTKGITTHDMACVKKYGKVFGEWTGSLYSVVTTDADIIREVYVKDFKLFPNPRMQFACPHDIQKNALPFIYDYPRWKAVRSVVTPTFSSVKLKQMSPFMMASIENVLKNVLAAADQSKPLEMKEVYGSYTMKLISSTAFGLDIDTQKDPNHPFIKNAKNAISSFLGNPITIVSTMFPTLKPFGMAVAKMCRPSPSVQYLDSILTSTLKDRRENRKSGRKDLLQLLIDAKLDDSQLDQQDIQSGNGVKRELTDIEIRSQSIVFLLAGYETTATTLSFMSYLFATNPDVQRRLCKEIDDVLKGQVPDYESIQKLPYLEMCLHESMRLFPPILRLSRCAEEDIAIKGYFLPKGTGVNVPVYALQRDPEYWPNPDKFDPERFSPANKDKNHPFALIPFSAGPRHCVGKRMALVAAKIAMATVLQHVTFEITSETQIPVQLEKENFICTAEKGIWLGVRRRNVKFSDV